MSRFQADLIFNVILVMLLVVVLKNISVNAQSESNLRNNNNAKANTNNGLWWLVQDEIVNMTINRDNTQLVAGDNLTFRCYIQRTCLTSGSVQCLEPSSTRWFVPPTLPARDNSVRKQITLSHSIIRQGFNHSTGKNETVYSLVNTLRLIQVGMIHDGVYECSSILESYPTNVVVRENSQRKCTYVDQCVSYNCYKSVCKCDNQTLNYIPQSDSCVTRKALNEPCETDGECAVSASVVIEPEFGQHLTPTKCSTGGTNSTAGAKTCQCSAGGVAARLATVDTPVCLAKVAYGGVCYANAQCQTSTIDADGAFCGLKLTTTTNTSTNAKPTPSFELTCQCKDGWHHVSQAGGGAGGCAPYTRCDSSKLGFNEHFAQGDCGANQFCRSSICLCVPNYEFTLSGQCLPQIGLDAWQANFFEQYGLVIIFGFAALALLVTTLAIVQFVRVRLLYRRRKAATADSQPVVTLSSIVANRDVKFSERL